MDCPFLIFLTGIGARSARAAAEEAFAELDRLERELSRFVPTSDISRINSSRGERVRLGPDAFVCLKIAEEMRELTRGAFDVTGGARAGGSLRLEAREHSVVAGGQGRTRVDLGGVGKGYALDRMAALLKEWGTGPALLSAGESTVLATAAPRGMPCWRLRLRHPSGRGTAGAVGLRRGAVSGSATVVRGRHIVDPRTGRVPAGGRRAAWAAAESAARADALSTAVFVMSDAEMRAVCRRDQRLSAALARRRHRGWKVVSFGRAAGVDLSMVFRAS